MSGGENPDMMSFEHCDLINDHCRLALMPRSKDLKAAASNDAEVEVDLSATAALKLRTEVS